MLTTTVRETEKVECFRLSYSTLSALLRGVSTKSDQPRFVRMELQFEFGKAHSHCCQKSPCVCFVLKSHHTVVCIAHKDDIASSMSLSPLMRPEIQRIVQIDV